MQFEGKYRFTHAALLSNTFTAATVQVRGTRRSLSNLVVHRHARGAHRIEFTRFAPPRADRISSRPSVFCPTVFCRSQNKLMFTFYVFYFEICRIKCMRAPYRPPTYITTRLFRLLTRQNVAH